MKKVILAAVVASLLTACLQRYTDKGNASIVSSKFISPEVVELVVKKDSGELVTMTRKYDAHATVGARVVVSDEYNQQDEDLKTIRRYEFK